MAEDDKSLAASSGGKVIRELSRIRWTDPPATKRTLAFGPVLITSPARTISPSFAGRSLIRTSPFNWWIPSGFGWFPMARANPGRPSHPRAPAVSIRMAARRPIPFPCFPSIIPPSATAIQPTAGCQNPKVTIPQAKRGDFVCQRQNDTPTRPLGKNLFSKRPDRW